MSSAMRGDSRGARRRFLLGTLGLLLLGAPSARADSGIETAGHAVVLALPAAAAALAFTRADGEGGLQLAESAGLSLGVAFGLKVAVDAERPDGGSGSFPSAHATLAFASAEFLRKRYGWEYGVPAYAAAAFVGYTRVEARRHYARDVLAGAALGAASSYLFTTPWEGWTARIETDGRSVAAVARRSW